ncbi:hypothetical protein [Tychonema sp. BBK16]|uniref:hypothetical protein n=1 Tax=Tychonema sp. BBK16 TaxID=2699888 RepID=UPI001F4733AC|nr:hypothetical protein [Tychonema sp. BBK16]MCF6372491.1 hypothetical protein [Tychonema sp. BBK16]
MPFPYPRIIDRTIIPASPSQFVGHGTAVSSFPTQNYSWCDYSGITIPIRRDTALPSPHSG